MNRKPEFDAESWSRIDATAREVFLRAIFLPQTRRDEFERMWGCPFDGEDSDVECCESGAYRLAMCLERARFDAMRQCQLDDAEPALNKRAGA